jgi:predicted nucleotidyltransferase
MSAMLLDDSVSTALFPKSRRAVLGLLYGQPDQAFYLREVVERTGLGVGHVQRELARLVQGTVIRRWKKGRHVYFQANPDCPVYGELQGLVMKTVGVVGVLRQTLQPVVGEVHTAFLYGSMARGEAREASDVDLMIIGEVKFAEVTRLVRPVEAELGREINPTVFPVGEFCDKVAEENHFVGTVLKAPKVFVVGSEDELAELLA